MNENPSASDWAAERGEKWLAQVSGLEAMLRPIDEPLIRALNLDAACRIADVGCGAGGTTLEILRRAPAGSIVHGFDLSPALVEAARRRIRSGESAIAFEIADMSAATAPKQLYDRLASRFGIMFFSDPSAAFTNLAQWLAPGGRFAFAAWRALAENPWMTTVRQTVADFVDLPAPEPGAPGPFRYADAEKLLLLLDRAGFTRLHVQDWRGELALGGGLRAAEASDFALTAFSSFCELLTRAGVEALEEARRLLATRLSRHERDGVVRMHASVHILTGARSF